VTITAAAGATTLTLDTTGGIANSDDILIYHSGAVSDSEFAKANTVTSPNVVLTDSLDKAHTALVSAALDNAEQWTIPIDLQGIRRLRIVVDNAKNSVAHPTVSIARMVVNTSQITV
jgi:hypothetical protein